MINRLADSYNRYILGRPGTVLLVLLAVFVFFAWCARDFRLDASADSLILESDEDLRIFREVNKRYETREFLFVVFTPKADLFSDTSLQTIDRVQRDLGRAPGVEAVFSLLDAPLVKMIDGGLMELGDNYRTLADPDTDRELARQELLSSPVFQELIISADGRTTALVVNLKRKDEYFDLQSERTRLLIKRDAEGLSDAERRELDENTHSYDQASAAAIRDNHKTIAAVREILNGYQRQGQFYVGGVPLISDDMITFIKGDMAKFGTGVLIFLVLMLSIIFRRPPFRFVAAVQLRICSGGDGGVAGPGGLARHGYIFQFHLPDAHPDYVHEHTPDSALSSAEPGFSRTGADRAGVQHHAPDGQALSVYRPDDHDRLCLAGRQRHKAGDGFRLDDGPGTGRDLPDFFPAVSRPAGFSG